MELKSIKVLAPILADLRKAGLIALSAGEQVIRLLPPLTVTEEELQQAVEIILATVLKEQGETA